MTALSDGLRARWESVDAATRAKILEAITQAVLDELKSDPWYSAFSGPPRVEILGARDAGHALVVHYIADHLNYCNAQSGSDWANHDLFLGDVAVREESLAPVRVDSLPRVNVTESTWDAGYDRDPWFSQLREAAFSRIGGTT